MTDLTSTPTATETLRERVRGALATVPLGEDDVHVFYVAEKHLDRLTDAVLAAVSAAAPDEREALPIPADDDAPCPRCGCPTACPEGQIEALTAEVARLRVLLDMAGMAGDDLAALAARPAPAVNAADVEKAVHDWRFEHYDAPDGEEVHMGSCVLVQDLPHVLAALGLTVADEGRAEDRIEREGGEE